MGDQITLGASDFVKVNITNSKTESVVFEKKFPKDISVADLKVSGLSGDGGWSEEQVPQLGLN